MTTHNHNTALVSGEFADKLADTPSGEGLIQLFGSSLGRLDNELDIVSGDQAGTTTRPLRIQRRRPHFIETVDHLSDPVLRRAVGATHRHIAAQFLAESAAIGLVGGIIGASIGVLVIVAVSATRQWTPVLDPWVPLIAPLVGAATGLIAGLYPSWRAASLEPIEALRTGT